MSFDSAVLLASTNSDDQANFPNSRYLTVGTGLEFTASSPGGTATISPTRMLGSIEELDTTGFLVRNAGDTVQSAIITNGDSTITVTNQDGIAGNPSIVVNPSTSLQKINVAFDGSVVGSAVDTINLIPGLGIGMYVQNTGSQINATISSSQTGGGGTALVDNIDVISSGDPATLWPSASTITVGGNSTTTTVNGVLNAPGNVYTQLVDVITADTTATLFPNATSLVIGNSESSTGPVLTCYGVIETPGIDTPSDEHSSVTIFPSAEEVSIGSQGSGETTIINLGDTSTTTYFPGIVSLNQIIADDPNRDLIIASNMTGNFGIYIGNNATALGGVNIGNSLGDPEEGGSVGIIIGNQMSATGGINIGQDMTSTAGINIGDSLPAETPPPINIGTNCPGSNPINIGSSGSTTTFLGRVFIPTQTPAVFISGSSTATGNVYTGDGNTLALTNNDSGYSNGATYDGTTITPTITTAGYYLLNATFVFKITLATNYPVTVSFGYQMDGTTPSNSPICAMAFNSASSVTTHAFSVSLSDILHLVPTDPNLITFTISVSEGTITFLENDIYFNLSPI